MSKGNLDDFPKEYDVLLTAADVAKALMITEAQLLDLTAGGKFPAPDDPFPGDPQWLFSTVIRYIDDQQQTEAAGPVQP